MYVKKNNIPGNSANDGLHFLKNYQNNIDITVSHKRMCFVCFHFFEFQDITEFKSQEFNRHYFRYERGKEKISFLASVKLYYRVFHLKIASMHF